MRSRSINRRKFVGGAAATAAVLAARPERARAQSGPIRITVGWPFAFGEQGVRELARRFTELNRSIKVEIQPIPQVEVVPKLTAAFVGGSAPDCIAFSDAWLVQFAHWLEDLDPYIAASGIEADIVPASMAIARMYHNKAYYVGFTIEAYSLYYNRRLFADRGLSEPAPTLDEFRQQAIKLTDASHNRYGFYVLGGSGWQFQSWCGWMVDEGGLGVDRTLYGADGHCILNSPRHVSGLQKWVELYRKDKVSPPASATATFQDQTNAFRAKQVAMVLGWGTYLSSLPAAIGETNVGVTMPPGGAAGRHFFYGGNGYSINAASRHKDAVWEFIRFLLRPENNSSWNRQFAAIPTNIKAWGDAWLKEPKYQAPLAMLRNVDNLVSNPRYLPGYASFQNQFCPEQIQKTLLGRQSVEQHARAIADALDRLRSKAG